MTKLPEKIVSLRKQNGLSQEALAEKLQVSRQAVSRWESGSALPDAYNILQLSKVFRVTADYLLDDEYEGDSEQPGTKQPKPVTNGRIGQIGAFCICLFGLLGNFTIYVISRFVEVMVPAVTYHNGIKMYTWNSEITSYSYKYFIQQYHLELLTILFCGFFIAGLSYILWTNETFKTRIKNVLSKCRTKKSIHR